MTVTIDRLLDDTGLLIEDRIEQRQCRVLTPDRVSPKQCKTENFLYPLDTAVTIETTELTISKWPTAYFRDENGELVAHIEHFTDRNLGKGDYILEVPGPVKLYLMFSGPLKVSVDAVQLSITFEESKEILVGARSYHERPAATITTTSDPADVIKAVSHFSTSLKTMTPERSYPNLRGHPPELIVGDELAIPDRLDSPENEIQIEVPEDLISTMIVSPLAYYLGAQVVPGEQARIISDSGFEYPLEGPLDLEDEVERVLKQIFLLDCLVRGEAGYGMPLRERKMLEPEIDFSFKDLYEATPPVRLEQYLSVSYSTIKDYLPRWKLTAHVSPSVESIEILPFLVDDLAVIRPPGRNPVNSSGEQVTAIREFARGSTRSGRGKTDQPHQNIIPQFVEPEETDSFEQSWVGDDVPIGASKALVEAFRNRLDREEKTGDIDIVVVCNDSEMLDEHNTASEVYGSRKELPFDVSLYDNLTIDRLSLLLESDIDYFHYIGHIDDGGFECEDGMLNVADLDLVGVDTFFLNACKSYQQGVELIKKGAIGGVVTLDEVINSGAVRVGKTMTRLLNQGFPLRAALSIAKNRSIVGSQYIVLGDGNAEVAQGTGPCPNLIDIHPRKDGKYDVDFQAFYSTSRGMGVGSFVHPKIAPDEDHYLTGSSQMQFAVRSETLKEFLELQVVPTRINNQFSWSNEVVLDDR